MAETENNKPDSAKPEHDRDTPPWLRPIEESAVVTEAGVNWRMVTIIVVALLAVTLFAGAVYYVYFAASPDESPVHVSAPLGAIKEKPEDAGGLKVPHQDKEIFEKASGRTITDTGHIGPQPEEPDLDILAEKDAVVANEENEAALGEQPRAQSENIEEAPVSGDVLSDGERNKSDDREVVANQPGAETKSVDAGFRAQLGAYSSQPRAEQAWREIRARFSQALSTMSPEYESVQSAGRTLVRLRVGPIADRTAADTLCLTLKAQNQGCIVIDP